MKTIEWTRTGGGTHRVTITTDEPCTIEQYQWAQSLNAAGALGWRGTANCRLVGNHCVNDQRGALWGIFGNWL